jgi:uncharacterized protein Veg
VDLGRGGKRRDALILPFQQIRNPTTTKKGKSTKLEREREGKKKEEKRIGYLKKYYKEEIT